MKQKYKEIIDLIYGHPVSANIRWSDIESLFRELGAEITEREGSRVSVFLFGEISR